MDCKDGTNDYDSDCYGPPKFRTATQEYTEQMRRATLQARSLELRQEHYATFQRMYHQSRPYALIDIAAHGSEKGKYIGVAERRYTRENGFDHDRIETFITKGEATPEGAAAWLGRESHPMFLFRADNKTQVQRYLEERNMTTFAATESERLRRQADRILARAEFLDNLPEEPDVEDAVIYFTKKFGGDKTYTYAAVRTDAGWYTTGPRTPKAYTWNDLVRWIYGDESDPYSSEVEIWVASEWMQVD